MYFGIKKIKKYKIGVEGKKIKQLDLPGNYLSPLNLKRLRKVYGEGKVEF